MKLVSACLLGHRCTWTGEISADKSVLKLQSNETLIAVCPEVLGGLSVPRERQEIVGGDGSDVIEGYARVMTITGNDVTDKSLRGARNVLMRAVELGVKTFIGRPRSPSCSSGNIYDGSFSGKLIQGDGVTAALLKKNGICVILPDQL